MNMKLFGLLSTIQLLLLFLLAGCVSRQNEDGASADRIEAIDTTAVVERGSAITRAAFQELSTSLGQAIQEGGIEHALQFCKVEALPLTDSLSTHYDVQLRRATHRPRNPSNRADSLEMETIRDYISRLERDEELKPAVYQREDQIIFHAPIVINNGLCLNCHGTVGDQINERDMELLKELYPDDKATGFTMGELRGIWSVAFPDAYFDHNENEESSGQKTREP